MDFNQKTYSKTADKAVIDEGLRQYMIKVYNYMTSGLLLTGIVAYFFGKASVVSDSYGQLIGLTPLGSTLFNSPLKWIIMLAPLGFVFYLSARMHKMSLTKAQTTFWIYSAIMGLSLSWIFIVFTQVSIIRVFFISSATFAAMSIYGYTTKKDLTKLGGFLFMGLIGIIIASLVNIFIGSSALQFAISVIGVLVFVGLTAYDTQTIKNMYYAGDSNDISGKKALMGALRLYLDFINLFILLLQLFGQRR
ncbi:MAG: Inner membrane protein YbhL [Alphaproteobacteria bacterium MarineAlpha5_Bin11]|nr:MAG: Inner membrane protein YbhL [Alphaproteobacteria bacterium MarineAlpha5_Bin11]PPR51893.1 MAG: Inner membrane protein YbhL [Alphaproteobacteria bacterium MarineAlpha5_Bin10]